VSAGLSRAACPLCASIRPPSPLTSWEGLTWWSCRSCGGGWREPYVPETEAADAETGDTYARYLENLRFFENIAREKADWVRRSAPLDLASMLEVGPGTGAVADALVQGGFPLSRYTAVEANPEFADALSRRGFAVFRGHTAEVMRAVAAHHNRESHSLVVLLDNVLEHVPDPGAFLSSLRDSLTIPCVVLVEVPNERGLRWRAPLHDALRGQRKPPTFPGHINLFTKRSLGRLLREVFPGHVSVRLKGLRHPDEVRRLLQSEELPKAVPVVLGVLRALPFDHLLGVAYFLRATAHAAPPERSA